MEKYISTTIVLFQNGKPTTATCIFCPVLAQTHSLIYIYIYIYINIVITQKIPLFMFVTPVRLLQTLCDELQNKVIVG